MNVFNMSIIMFFKEKNRLSMFYYQRRKVMKKALVQCGRTQVHVNNRKTKAKKYSPVLVFS